MSELLRLVEAGNTISNSEWSLLANYAWGQGRGSALGERDEPAVFSLLADSCPDDLAVEKSKFQMMVIDRWSSDDERDQSKSNGYLGIVSDILGNPMLTRANIYSFAYLGSDHVLALAEGAAQQTLQNTIREQLEVVIADKSESVLLRLDAIFGWADVSIALLPEEEALPSAEQAWVVDQIATAKAEVTGYEQHSALNTIWQLYYAIDMEAEARESLKEGIATSKQPFYFMSSLGYLEKESGNIEPALQWYRKAWETAEGPATRIQWGVSYLSNLLELAPEDTALIDVTGRAIFAELASQTDPLHQRNIGRMSGLSDSLLEWQLGGPEGAEDPDTQVIPERGAIVLKYRAAMSDLCAGYTGDGEAIETCASFLIPAADEAEDLKQAT